jgi:transketolase
MSMNLALKSVALRRTVLETVYGAKAGHIGGDLSVLDFLNVLYNGVMDITPENFHTNDRDHFILSKGHSVEALYAVLADKGFFEKSDLATVSRCGSKYIGHPNHHINGIEMNSGSLGHGLSVAVGMALALRMDRSDHRVYVVMGDGEMAEGSVWEGAMAAGHYGLDHLIAVVDRNRLQISGNTERVMAQGDVKERFRAFGWHCIETDGNDTQALLAAFVAAGAVSGKPVLIEARTVKGCGVSFMENQPQWHHKVPDAEEYARAMRELRDKEAVCRG